MTGPDNNNFEKDMSVFINSNQLELLSTWNVYPSVLHKLILLDIVYLVAIYLFIRFYAYLAMSSIFSHKPKDKGKRLFAQKIYMQLQIRL